MQTSHRVKRAARKGALYAVEPFDRAIRRLNGKRGYPPLPLRRQNGPLNTFERVTGEYVAYLVTLANLSPKSHVLDVGCGSGAMPIMLQERLGRDGQYIGFEVDRPTANWCRKHLGSDRYRFFHHDYWNATYNPAGEQELPWPVDKAWADVILLKSIFTHMLPDDVEFYLHEISRTLSKDGNALVTAFLYEDSRESAGRHTFALKGKNYRYNNEASPESAIALDIDWFRTKAAEAGLNADIMPGLWRDDPAHRPIGYQDMIVLSKI